MKKEKRIKIRIKIQNMINLQMKQCSVLVQDISSMLTWPIKKYFTSINSGLNPCYLVWFLVSLVAPFISVVWRVSVELCVVAVSGWVADTTTCLIEEYWFNLLIFDSLSSFLRARNSFTFKIFEFFGDWFSTVTFLAFFNKLG